MITPVLPIVNMAGPSGFEPEIERSKRPVIPFHYRPTKSPVLPVTLPPHKDRRVSITPRAKMAPMNEKGGFWFTQIVRSNPSLKCAKWRGP